MSVNANEPDVTNSNRPYMDDEIDLFELAESLWKEKLIIIIITMIFAIAGYAYTIVEKNKPAIYKGEILVETGAYVTSENEIKNLHSPNDLAMMIGTLKNVSAEAPKGTSSIINVSISHHDEREVLAKFEDVFRFVKQRDDVLIEKLKPEQIIKTSQPIGEPQIDEKAGKSAMLIILLSIVLGGMLGIFVALIRSAVENRRVLDINS